MTTDHLVPSSPPKGDEDEDEASPPKHHTHNHHDRDEDKHDNDTDEMTEPSPLFGFRVSLPRPPCASVDPDVAFASKG